MLSEISQSEKDKNHDFSPTWNVMDELNRKQNRNRLLEQADSSGRGGAWEVEGLRKKKKNSGTQTQCGDCGERGWVEVEEGIEG